MSTKISLLPPVLGANLLETDLIPVVASSVTSSVKVSEFRSKLGFARIAATYGATVNIVASSGNEFDITATNGTAFTIANPTQPIVDGQRITITVRNTSGGALGAVTWDTLYKLAAWTSPATGFSRSIDFKYNGTNWVEASRTTVDVPN